MTAAYAGQDRTDDGDVHTERCIGLTCPCWIEGAAFAIADPADRALVALALRHAAAAALWAAPKGERRRLIEIAERLEA